MLSSSASGSDSQFSGIPQEAVGKIPSELLGKSMRLGELSTALGKYGVADMGRRTLYSYITKGIADDKTGEVIRMRGVKMGRVYRSTIVWVCKFIDECDKSSGRE